MNKSQKVYNYFYDMMLLRGSSWYIRLGIDARIQRNMGIFYSSLSKINKKMEGYKF
jgi:hypothetical protein